MVEAAGYQIALEAISNAYSHSGGDGANVRIGVDAQGTNLVIDVADNGGASPLTLQVEWGSSR